MSENETLENKRKKLIFRAGHRGTKEMDLILGSFAAENVPSFTPDEVDQFEELLNVSDPDLYNWITGKEEVRTSDDSPVMQKFLAYKYASKT